MKRISVNIIDGSLLDRLSENLIAERLSFFGDLKEAVYQELDKLTQHKYNEIFLRNGVDRALKNIIIAYTNDSLIKRTTYKKLIKQILKDLKCV